MELNLKNKTFAVAASTKGIGWGIAKTLLEEGSNVGMCSRSTQNIALLKQRLTPYGGRSIISQTDMGSQEQITEWLKKIINTYERLDGIVINAGGPPPGTFETLAIEDWQNAFHLTLMSAVHMIREALPYLKENGGSILAVTSSSVKEPIDNLLLSNVMRSGVTSLIKSVATDFAKYGIRANCIVPGIIDTDRVKSLDRLTADHMGVSVEQSRKNRENSIPIGRYGKIEEFGQAAAFLLSEAAAYISGVSFVVDGGKMKSIL